jgi:hypothetical protein
MIHAAQAVFYLTGRIPRGFAPGMNAGPERSKAERRLNKLFLSRSEA